MAVTNAARNVCTPAASEPDVSAVGKVEQTATTNQMGRNVGGSSCGANDIAKHTAGFAMGTQNTTSGVSGTLEAASGDFGTEA